MAASSFNPKWMGQLDVACVPSGLLLLAGYHAQLFYRVWKHPSTTTIGVNQASRNAWLMHVMEDPTKYSTAAVQALRNGMMVSIALASASLTLSSLLGGLVAHRKGQGLSSSIELLSVLVCLLLAFLFNLQYLRYMSHISLIMCFNLSGQTTHDQSDNDVCQAFQRGSLFWSMGLRALYFCIPLFMWLFGPIPMFLCSCIMVILLHLLDTVPLNPRKIMERSDSMQKQFVQHDYQKQAPI